MTACSCNVGSIRIEVAGSKHDGIYNFLAKGLGDTIRCVHGLALMGAGVLERNAKGGVAASRDAVYLCVSVRRKL